VVLKVAARDWNVGRLYTIPTCSYCNDFIHHNSEYCFRAEFNTKIFTKMKLSLSKPLLLLSLALFAFGASAQIGVPSAALSIKITPEFPDPRGNVVATAISYSTDLDRASIAWMLDGEILAQGTGLKEVSFQAAAHGSKNTLSATVVTPEGKTFAATVEVSPQAVDLFTEAKTMVPHWYKGAALPGGGSRVVVTALPDFRSGSSKISASSLTYEWRIDGRVNRDASGRGKNKIVVAAPGPGEVPKDIELKVSTSDGLIAKETFASVRAFPAEVLFYEKRGQEGILRDTLKIKMIKAGSGFEVKAVPFFSR
jgi:hypothetical protein